MSTWVISLSVMAGIALLAAVSHGLTGLARRPRDRAMLALAVASAAVAVGALSVAIAHDFTSMRHVYIYKWLVFPASAVWMVGVLWFVAYSSGVQPTRWLVALSSGFAGTVILNAALPYGFLHRQTHEIELGGAPGFATLVALPVQPHPLIRVHDVLVVAAMAFIVYALFSMSRGARQASEKKRTTWGYLALILPLVALTLAIDFLDDIGVGFGFGQYVTQIGFFAAVVTTSVAVQVQSLQAEASLVSYKSSLEDIVEARTKDLTETSATLTREVADHVVTKELLLTRLTELDALQRIAEALARHTDFHHALADAATYVGDLLDVRHVQVDLLAEDPEQSIVVATNTAIADLANGPWDRSNRLPVETTDEFEEAVSRGQAATIADVSSLQLPLETGEHVSAPGLRQALLVPLIGRSDPVGVLSLVRGNDGKDAFSDRDMRLTQMVADSFAIAVENDRLHLLERQQAADRERDRLARDLHDAVTQSIYSASLIAEALPAVWERSSDEGLKNLERLRILVRGALSEMRTLLFELRPSTLQHADLYMLVEHLANALAGQTQIPVDVRMQEEARLPVEVKITLYRVAQEAFSNIAKHARASRVSISLGTDHEQVVMRIEDDGCGFDQSAVPSGHMGIQIIRERLDQIGAALLIDSAVGRGTTVTVVWPRPDPD